jgi:hypothetical protein
MMEAAHPHEDAVLASLHREETDALAVEQLLPTRRSRRDLAKRADLRGTW